MNTLRAIPLPLRIAAVFLGGLLLYQLIGRVPSGVFIILACVFWTVAIVTWAYDQGWLNALARVPGVSGVLGFIADRASLAGPASRSGPGPVSAPPGELDDAERRALHASASQTLAALRGNEIAKDLISQRIIVPAMDHPDNPFGSTAPAAIILIAGPRGVGKTTVACAVANLLTGVAAVKTAKIVTVRPTDIRTGEFSSAVDLARTKTRMARFGTLFIDDADWLLDADPYGSGNLQGSDFGLTLVETAAEFPQEILVVATMTPETLGRLKEDAKHQRWLGKLARREVLLEALDDEALLDVLDTELVALGWQFENSETATAARRLMSDIHRRQASGFDNAIACRRTAETLVEITIDNFEAMAKQRKVGRESIRIADQEMD